MNHYLVGDLAPALEAVGRTRAIAETLGDPRPQAWSAWGTGFLLASAGDWDAAARECRRALELVSDPVNTSMALGLLGFALTGAGHAADAIAPLEQAIALSREFEVRQHEGLFLAFLADAHRLLGDLERATALARRSLEVGRAAGYAVGVGTAQRALGRVALAQGDHAAAAVPLEEALATFGSIGARLEMARTRELLAEVCRGRGDGLGAERHAAEGAALVAACRLPPRGAAPPPLAPAADAS
jgi:tetratricopeptide (TPR) repeat protein